MKLSITRKLFFRAYLLGVALGLVLVGVSGYAFFGKVFAAKTIAEGFFDVVVLPTLALTAIGLGLSERHSKGSF